MEYKVKLEIFEGPLDLLLHLIKDNEIDIYDIPIVAITTQYIEYIDFIKALNLDIAGEFLVMAAELAKIKSRMLLPATVSDGMEEEEEEDPREALVKRLIEYKKYKEASEMLKEKERYQKELFTREHALIDTDISEEEMISDISVFDLVCAFKNIMKNISYKSTYEISIDEMSVSDKINHIIDTLHTSPQMTFDALFANPIRKVEVIVTFLALLELIRQKLIRIYQAKQFGTIRIVKNG